MSDTFQHIGGVDLEACDREPIHIIGSIQPHGALLAVDAASLAVTHTSANIEEFLGQSSTELQGQHLRDVIGTNAYDDLLGQDLSPAQPDHLRPWSIDLSRRSELNGLIETYAHKHAGQLIVELVRSKTDSDVLWDEDRLRQRIISELVRPDATDKLAQVSADIVRMVTEFDRVMIYRFAADNHGEVVAESTNRDDSFLGLHYPASDIPEPARRHFRLNIIRNIPDIRAEPVPVLSHDGQLADAISQAPLDLTYAKLRGVSPVHLQYLANNGRQRQPVDLVDNE